jgi:hypothetical protein
MFTFRPMHQEMDNRSPHPFRTQIPNISRQKLSLLVIDACTCIGKDSPEFFYHLDATCTTLNDSLWRCDIMNLRSSFWVVLIDHDRNQTFRKLCHLLLFPASVVFNDISRFLVLADLYCIINSEQTLLCSLLTWHIHYFEINIILTHSVFYPKCIGSFFSLFVHIFRPVSGVSSQQLQFSICLDLSLSMFHCHVRELRIVHVYMCLCTNLLTTSTHWKSSSNCNMTTISFIKRRHIFLR